MLWDEWKQYASDEARWVTSTEKGLLKAEYLTGYVLRLWFEEVLDVSIYELDFEPLFITEEPGPALLPLRKSERFRFVRGDGVLIWPNPETGDYDDRAIDLAPECVRFFCERYGKVVKPFGAAVVA